MLNEQKLPGKLYLFQGQRWQNCCIYDKNPFEFGTKHLRKLKNKKDIVLILEKINYTNSTMKCYKVLLEDIICYIIIFEYDNLIEL